VLIKSLAALRVTRSLQIALGFAAAMPPTLGGGRFLFSQPVCLLTRLTKLDDVTHTRLDDHPASEAVVACWFLNPKCAGSVAMPERFPCTPVHRATRPTLGSRFGKGFDGEFQALSKQAICVCACASPQV
jgi:hypothetical protein